MTIIVECAHAAARTCGSCRRQCCTDCDEMVEYERVRMNIDVGFTCVDCEVKGPEYCRACSGNSDEERKTIGCLRHGREWQQSIMGVWVPFEQ